MITRFFGSLKAKLMAAFLVVSLVPLTAISFLAYNNSKEALYEAELSKLDELRSKRTSLLKDYLRYVSESLKFLAVYDRVQMFLDASRREDMASERSASGDGAGASGSVDPVTVNRMNFLLSQYFAHLGKRLGLEDALLMRPDGAIVFTLKRLSDLGGNVKSGSLRQSGLGQAFDKVVKTNGTALVDFAPYEPSGGTAAFLAVPVLSADGSRFCGVIAGRLNAEGINEVLKLQGAAGRTAGAYLVGADRRMRSVSRFSGASELFKEQINTEPVKEGLKDRQGHMRTLDYRGEPVFSSYSDVGLNEMKEMGADFDWVQLLEIDEAEAILPVLQLRSRIVIVALITAAFVLVIGYLLAAGIGRPITALAAQADRVRQGDLTVTVTALTRRDEIGTLTGAFKDMVEGLRTQTARTLEGVNVLTSAAAEISSTIAQLSVSTAKTSASVSQTTSTVEEVKQAARIVGEKAQVVAQSALRAVDISERGKQATDDTIHRMNLIKEQMESIGETVVRLSEQTGEIEDIIAAVQDLADQSNLLAVNASIEAARAGDQGKGFAVVAHEIKSLADQSKQATGQVRGILDDTRRWVSAVVMATEQGNKAVDAGVQQSRMAGESIEALAGSVAESSQAATVIDVSTTQQFVGVDQVSGAMVHIELAMQQSASGASQLESSARDLQRIARSLTEVVQQYRVA